MAFIDDFGEKLDNVAQIVSKKSSNIIESTKLNMKIKTEEESIKKIYYEIGKQYVIKNGKRTAMSEPFASLCMEIKEHEENIKEYKQKLNEIRNIKICSNCGASIPVEHPYCYQCGHKMEDESQASADAETESSDAGPDDNSGENSSGDN